MRKTKNRIPFKAAALAVAAASVLAFAALAMAAGKIEVKISAAVPVETADPSGKKTTKMVDAAVAKVLPGDTVTYTITYTNTGDTAAKDVVVANPIPAEMEYVDQSAAGAGTSITFSVDKGKTFYVPAKLTVKDKDGKKRRAKASEYTNIRWTLKGELPPGKGGSVEYLAKVK